MKVSSFSTHPITKPHFGLGLHDIKSNITNITKHSY